MALFATAVGLSLLGGVGGLLLASTLLLFHDRIRQRLVPWLISYAIGTLLGVALLALLPEAMETLAPARALTAVLAGIIIFFILEKLVLWRHCHSDDCEVHTGAASIVLVGDAVHSFVDGALIAASVMSSVPLGVSTAVAVAAHEIPQEVGDFALLLAAGYSRRRALTLNLFSGASSAVGAIAALAALDVVPDVLPYFLAFSAAALLYVAMADLMPDLHRGRPIDAAAFRQILLLVAGIVTVLAL